MFNRTFLVFAFGMFCMALTAHSVASDCVDVEGSDHPQLPRYADACLIGHVSRDFDAVTIPTGPAVSVDGNWTTESAEALEGRTTRLMYLIPHGRSALEVFRNYERSLSERGFEILFSCATDACGPGGGQRLQNLIYPSGRSIGRAGQHSATAFNFGVSDRRYLAARSKDGLTVVGVFLAEANQIFLKENKNRVVVHVEVVELAEMEQRMIDASEMAKSIGETGSVKLDNVYFDFGAATLTAQSDAAIAEMATLLKENPGLDIYVVGHTDSVGAYQANLDLSRRRAEAVVNALVTRHGIRAAAVIPAGVGPLAPIASNATEAGRAQNRRVELVAR
jgi:OmpA-OmpF porin, OOP family